MCLNIKVEFVVYKKKNISAPQRTCRDEAGTI